MMMNVVKNVTEEGRRQKAESRRRDGAKIPFPH
jgi:hypothetical protein